MEKKTKKRLIRVAIALLVCVQLVLLVPQLSIRAAILLRGYVAETFSTEVTKVEIDFLPKTRLFSYRYYELSNPPKRPEADIYGLMESWRVRNILFFWNIADSFDTYAITLDIYAGMLTEDGLQEQSVRQFVPEGKTAVADPKRCETLQMSLVQSGYVLNDLDYNLDEIKKQQELVFTVNESSTIRLLTNDKNFGYVQIVNEDQKIDRVFAIPVVGYQEIKACVESAM